MGTSRKEHGAELDPCSAGSMNFFVAKVLLVVVVILELLGGMLLRLAKKLSDCRFVYYEPN